MEKSACLTILFICLLQTVLLGCDSEKILDRSSAQLAAGDRNVAFDCNKRKDVICESGFEYCLRSTMALDRNWYKTSECVPKPENCNACECSKENAKEYFSMAKNCKGEIYCRIKNSQIVVTCVVPNGATDMDQEPSRNFVEKPAGNS